MEKNETIIAKKATFRHETRVEVYTPAKRRNGQFSHPNYLLSTKTSVDQVFVHQKTIITRRGERDKPPYLRHYIQLVRVARKANLTLMGFHYLLEQIQHQPTQVFD